MPLSLDAWLLRLEQSHPVAIELGLGRVGLVADRLGVRRFAAPVITIAGTNGKGSTAATLTAIAVAAGLRVVTYTSPHLLHFNERICLNGQPASDTDLVQAFEAVEQVRGEVSLTYFEHSTLAAFWWFQRQQPELVVLEVGLGGRLDAVNLVDADVAVITGIDLDHQDWLGDTRELIAVEKAGIRRPGRPLVLGERDPLPVLRALGAASGCPLWVKGECYDFRETGDAWDWTCTNVGIDWQGLPKPGVACDNAATALAALQALAASGHLLVAEADVRQGLPRAAVTGRAQCLGGLPELWVDVGHNPQGARFLWSQLPAATAGQRTHAVIGMLADKDVVGVIAASRHQVDVWWPATLPGPRGLSGQDLAALLTAEGLRVGQVSDHVDVALAAARQAASSDDRIIAFGSFLTVAAVLAQFG